MKHTGTTFRLTLAALGTVALFGAAAAAGVDRSTEMMSDGISPVHMPAESALLENFISVGDSARID